ncbi:MAG: BON domain-containing protein [Gammaproteobacteria bacterium]|jgi:osmotically-inducible protein OsmY
MTDAACNEIRRQLFASLEREPRINVHQDEIDLAISDGVTTLSGEVANIAAKRLTLELAARLPGVSGIVDRLHTRPATKMGDGEVADELQQALIRDSAFHELTIIRAVGNSKVVIRNMPRGRYAWYLEFRVEDGIVTLDGEVPSLSHKRLAGTMAWWVPGSRDVINGLGVEPAEQDSDAEILDALRLVLEKDPLVDASQVDADCEDSVIGLRGTALNEAQREIIEFDAWSLFGVDDVTNELEIVAS